MNILGTAVSGVVLELIWVAKLIALSASVSLQLRVHIVVMLQTVKILIVPCSENITKEEKKKGGKMVELSLEEQNALLAFVDDDNENYINEEYIPAGWKQVLPAELLAWVDSQINPSVCSLIKKGILTRSLDFKTSRFGEKSMKVRISVSPFAMVRKTESGVVASVLP